MDLARQEYPSLLTSLEPDYAVDVLNNRVAVINKTHADIADWLGERRRIEEQYAASLRKLSRRPQQDNATSLGVFHHPWQRIVASVENLAQSHETFAAKIQTDVEAPLRQYHSTNREIQSMGNIAGNLAAISKELSSAQKKAQKLEARGGSRAGGASSSLEDAQAQWDSQAPFVFEQLQALDEVRINHLRDVLTQFQTHELDVVEKVKVSAESCINALLNVETADEIKAFAARTKNQTSVAPTRQDSMSTSARPSGSSVPPTPPPPRNTGLEQRNPSFTAAEPSKEKSKMSGLKRFSTVMGRRKGAVPPPPPSASEKKKEKTRSFVPFRRQESSRSFQDLESTGAELSPSASRDDRTGSRPEFQTPPATQESRISEASPPALNGLPAGQQSPQRDTSEMLPQIQSLQQPLMPDNAFRNAELQQPAGPPPNRQSRNDPFSAALDTPSLAAEEPSRNFEIKDQPIPEDESAAQLALNNTANQLRMQAPSSILNRAQSGARGRRDVRNTMFVPNPNTNELPSPVGTPSIGAPSTPASAVTAPSAFTSVTTATPTGGSSSELTTPIKRSLGTGTIPEDHTVGSDTQSVHSSHSMAILPHHQELHNPGLNASIVETVNTWFSDAGVTRSFVVGEVALAYNHPPTSTTPAPSSEMVRLQNFHQLEKCAQNPAFVTVSDATSTTSAAEDQSAVPGTYNVALSSISRSIPTVAFKYQLHLPETSPNLSAYSPILITQAWQIMEGQASVICFYSLNPSFAPIANPGTSPVPPPTELTLKNVTVTISLDTKPGTASSGSDMAPAARAVSAQMMPVQNASFKKRSGAVAWRFPELTIKPTQERLLVRFMVENNGLAKRGGVDVKFEIPNMLGSALGVERLNTSEAGKTETDPFADEDEAAARKSAEQSDAGDRWEDISSRKILVAGKYTAS